jgi:hypothetical protein
MAAIAETPIQSELDFYDDLIAYDPFTQLNLEFVVDGLIDFNIIRPAEGYEISEL